MCARQQKTRPKKKKEHITNQAATLPPDPPSHTWYNQEACLVGHQVTDKPISCTAPFRSCTKYEDK